MEAPYAAGLFDGEGTVGIYRTTNGRPTQSGDKTYWAIRLSIVGIYQPTIRDLYNQFGGGYGTQKRQALQHVPGSGGKVYDPKLCRQGWRWMLTSRPGVEKFLRAVRPYLREKSKQADIALDFIEGKLSGMVASVQCRAAKCFEFPRELGDVHATRGNVGSLNQSAKLDETKVAQIRQRVSSGESTVLVARDIGISRNTAWRIATKRSWKHCLDGSQTNG
jgi:hypothetical protein